MLRVNDLLIFLSLFLCAKAELVDPSTVTCGSSEYTFCDYENGLIRGGAVARQCSGQCLCEGHPSFYGDNLDWIDGQCVTTKDSACGPSTNGDMSIFCPTETECIEGRCREPNFTKLAEGFRCRDNVECEEGLKCRMHTVQTAPRGDLWHARERRAIGPQWCCSSREAEHDYTMYTRETLPCKA